MQKDSLVFALALGSLMSSVRADECSIKPATAYQIAMVVSVDRHRFDSWYVGGSPTDAPLQPHTYSWEIGIRLDCNMYVGLYESPTNYLPSVFTPKHEVDVRLHKHTLYVNLPFDDDDELRMSVVRRRRIKDETCPAPAQKPAGHELNKPSTQGTPKGDIA